MQQSPKDEGIVRPMPESADEKDDHGIQVGSQLPPSVSTQGKINVGAQETGQGDMPPLPEVRRGKRLIRGVEIDRQIEVEQLSQPYRHIGITGKVKIDLEGISEQPRHQIKGGCIRCTGKNKVCRHAESIRKQHLLGQTQGKHHDAAADIFCIPFFPYGFSHLRDQLLWQHNRPCHQLRKKGDEKGILSQTVSRRFSLIGIHYIGDLLEGKETDAERQ